LSKVPTDYLSDVNSGLNKQEESMNFSNVILIVQKCSRKNTNPPSQIKGLQRERTKLFANLKS